MQLNDSSAGRRSGRRRTKVLSRDFYGRRTLVVTRELLGKVLVHETSAGRTAGVIVEVEAYIGEEDPACHAAPGPTRRNAPLYGPPGYAYVYLNYGVHTLVNVVTEPPGHPAAVLVRALEPLEGLALMRRRRSRGARAGSVPADHQLCRGPGNLARALGITLAENRVDLCRSRLRIEDHDGTALRVRWSERIGIRVGTDRPWRCFVPGSSAVSRLPRAPLL